VFEARHFVASFQGSCFVNIGYVLFLRNQTACCCSSLTRFVRGTFL